MHLVFSGGGTAGHLFPGLAVADELRIDSPEMRITFVGTGKSLERRLVEKRGFQYLQIAARPLPRLPHHAFRFITDAVSGYVRAASFIAREKVDLVVGLGGYVSVPMARAAANCRTPLVLLEQNAVPGRATRFLSGSAAAVCAAFHETVSGFRPGARVKVTGNPLRREVAQLASLPQRVAATSGQLLVIGGSGGSRVLNETAPLAIYKAKAALAGWTVLHQTGPRRVAAVRQLYSKLGIEAEVRSFIDDMPRVLAATDLAISRAGGTALAELAAARSPAIVLPFPKALDDHQRKNAEVFRAAGACRTLDEETTPGRLDDSLAELIVRLAGDATLRLRMSENMARLAKPHAAAHVVKTIRRVLAHRRAAA